MRNGDAFAAGYVMGKATGLAVYRALPDGALDRIWTFAGQEGSGTEALTPVK